ncbi:MAG: YbjN domain-containing protein [Selenomonadaceae bacterium]|nr:YbjN domain-containing protein [Selenomonadaceae bacterium]
MNKKAEAFAKYLEEKDTKAFAVEEIPEDPQHTVLFRSHLLIEGQQLPLLVLLDDSAFAVLRVQVSPKALTEENTVALHQLVNEENMKYKPFKLYFDKAGDLILDSCLLAVEDEVPGDQIYNMFDVIIRYLNESYRAIMKAIW